MTIHQTKKHFRLFLASPGDVSTERDAVEEVVKYFNLNNNQGIHIDVIRWEDHATPNYGRPQQVIFENTDFKNTDIFVGIFWYRIGSPTGKIDPQTGDEYLSGTIEELKAGFNLITEGRLTLARFMLYFCERPIPKIDFETLKQATKVAEFKDELDKTKKLLYKKFNTTDNFKYIFKNDLEKVTEDILPIALQIIATPPSFPKSAKFRAFISKMCNRNTQVNDFWSFFQTKFKEFPKRPQFYFVHGEEGEGHESLVRRLIKTCIKEFAEKEWGDQYSPYYFKPVPCPHIGNIEKCKRDLEMNLFREFDIFYNGTEYSANVLSRVPSVSKHNLVIIEHTLYATKWDKQNIQLISWYINEFWAKLECNGDIPQFIIFINIKYPKMYKFKLGFKILKWKKYYKDQIKDHLNNLLKFSDVRCPCSIIEELTPITIEDIKEWFSIYDIYDNELVREEKINIMFKGKNQPVNFKSMSEVELWLEKIYNEYLEERKL